ncbi:hypothetical protein M8C21_018806 [Ambrosia artemisiifolia]|uniref:Uncharacterized protein n=1 Tax=Ambrosia artemisiifolia TaxID=4212 RepID=A0AAD5D871_AMBAR|nr:hypothetical protein M8C21_018806 [Ambrosia artemisiifolia]
MEGRARILVVSLLLSCFAVTSYAVYFSSLKETLVVTASPIKGQVLKAGEDKITVTWRFNQTYSAGTDSDYKTVKVAYGQTTDAHKSTNLFDIQAITGRHVSLDIASACFSAFSIVSLAGFFYMEKRKANTSQQK